MVLLTICQHPSAVGFVLLASIVKLEVPIPSSTHAQLGTIAHKVARVEQPSHVVIRLSTVLSNLDLPFLLMMVSMVSD